MMNIVLHADTMEPITVIDIPDGAWLDKVLELRCPGSFMVIVPDSVSMANLYPTKEIRMPRQMRVEIHVEWMTKKGRWVPVFFTHEKELALLLKSELLPGQRDEQQALTAQELERRQTPRQREINQELAQLRKEMYQEYLVRAQPQFDELLEIEGRKPPLPIMAED